MAKETEENDGAVMMSCPKHSDPPYLVVRKLSRIVMLMFSPGYVYQNQADISCAAANSGKRKTSLDWIFGNCGPKR
jgi:hypothetical protein